VERCSALELVPCVRDHRLDEARSAQGTPLPKKSGHDIMGARPLPGCSNRSWGLASARTSNGELPLRINLTNWQNRERRTL